MSFTFRICEYICVRLLSFVVNGDERTGQNCCIFCLPSGDSLFGVLDVPSPLANPGLSNGGVWTRDDDGFRVEIGADIDGRRLANANGRLSSESLSVEPPK